MIISNKYRILNKLGEGNYGNVYIGEHIFLKKTVAIKISKESENILLKNEAKIYKFLENTNGVPQMLLYGVEDSKCFVILDKLEYQLERNKNQDICNIGIDMIKIIENIHNKGVIHRDIKPDNFMYKNGKLYLLDYGLATMYLDNGEIHKPENKISNIIGSINYISVNVHKYILPSRRDDIESIIYVLFYLYNKLEWENLTEIEIKNKKYNLLYNFNVEEIKYDNILCILYKLLIYIRNLNYVDKPDYNYMYKQLKD